MEIEVMEDDGKQMDLIKTEPRAVQQAEPTVMDLLNNAVASGSIEMAERLLALKERFDAIEAEKAFNAAFAKFQLECPIIEKRKPVKNKDGTVKYYYAPLDDIVAQVKEPLSKNGFSYTINTKQDADMITSVIELTHIQGHKKVSEFGAKVEGEYMNNIQKHGNTRTYVNRYNFMNILGIMTADPDDDAVSIEDALEYADQIKALRACGKDKEALVSMWKDIYKDLQAAVDRRGKQILEHEYKKLMEIAERG